MRKIFGSDRVDSLIWEMGEQEQVEAELEKERRKVHRKAQRDAR